MIKAKMPVIICPTYAADKAAWHGLWAAYMGFDGMTLSANVPYLTFGSPARAALTVFAKHRRFIA